MRQCISFYVIPLIFQACSYFWQIFNLDSSLSGRVPSDLIWWHQTYDSDNHFLARRKEPVPGHCVPDRWKYLYFTRYYLPHHTSQSRQKVSIFHFKNTNFLAKVKHSWVYRSRSASSKLSPVKGIGVIVCTLMLNQQNNSWNQILWKVVVLAVQRLLWWS